MIDIKLQNGEIQTDSAGRYAVIEDRDALFQRAALNMTIAKGSFVYNRALGAEPCLDSNPDKRELVLGEALATYENTAVRVTGITADATAVEMTIDGESRETEVRHIGSL